MDLFTIDTAGDTGHTSTFSRPTLLPTSSSSRPALDRSNHFSGKSTNSQKQPAADSDDDDDEDYGGLPPPSQDIFKILHDDESTVMMRDLAGTRGPSIPKKARYAKGTNQVQELAVTDVNKQMKSAVLTPAVEKQENLAALSMTDRKIKELNKKERSKTKGKDWFNLPAQEMTDEVKNELELIRMRSVLDPKHFYKRSEMKTLPKYFQIGKVLESPLDYYNERGQKKSNAKTLVDELLENAQFQKYNKKKYAEALEKRKKKAYHKAAIKMKRLKKKKH
ncbi:deoxynucleotidyltransferase terminal-interacting protein 2 [Ochlerotatus camptorhynchus]|uniref:deoxynucleotidyltransferase terminal-interacting protein 2 n=1 Tax=Ochlerotatus camptorhynchus TaxID=644619 RepID=UPI0031D0D925